MITTDEVLNRREEGGTESKFLEAERQPTEAETRLMFSLALRELIMVCMRTHMYSVGTDGKLQSDGGPIGLKLSGAVGRVFMINWCRRFREKMRRVTEDITDCNCNSNFDIHLYKFYVDDHNLVCEALPPGARLVGEKGEEKVEVITEEVENDLTIPADQRTAKLMQEVANSICKHTQMDVDFPSNNPDGWLPILDNKVRIDSNMKVDWCFYKKPVDSELYILNRSALSNKIKKATLSQEGLRRLRNTRPDMVQQRKGRLLTDMAEGMLKSGYPEEYRRDVLESSIIAYKKQVAASDAGKTPLYRPREWKREERARKKRSKRGGWYRPADTVMFVPATPESELADRVKSVVDEECKRLGFKVKVVERGGVTMKQHLVKTDMGRSVPCPMEDCLLCLTNPGEGGGARHHRAGALYSGTCCLCREEHGEQGEGERGGGGGGGGEGEQREQGKQFESVYFGESGDSGYVRILRHGLEIEKKESTNAFAKHLEIYHPDQVGNKTAFEFRVIKTFKSPLMRQIYEAVKIHSSTADIVLNSKSEWHQPATDRVVVTREPR